MDILDNEFTFIKKKKYGTFKSMELHPSLLNAIQKKGYKQPTPIQRKVIPIALTGVDLIAMARTGSGKTLAFTVPIVHKLVSNPIDRAGIRALILSPTRELSQQTFKYTKALTKGSQLKISLIIGGDNLEGQFHQLAANPDIVIATPGRLLHIIHETGLSLKLLEFLVLDEADRLLEMGFQAELEAIVKEASSQRQTLLFSATLPQILVEFSKVGLKNPEIVRLDTESQLSENLYVGFLTVRTEDKEAALLTIIKECMKEDEQAIVFAATKHHVDYLHEILNHSKITSSTIYGSLDPAARRHNLNLFVKKKVRILLVTDVAARGIDIPELDVVINYDFPPKPKLFVHRVGRTARAGKSGAAYSILQLDELPYLLDLMLYLNSTKVQNKINDKENCVNGRFPSHYLNFETEQILKIKKSDQHVQALHKSMVNATKLYRENRSKPSSSSVERAKEMIGKNGILSFKIHPLFEHLTNEDENELENFVQNQLKTFRPSQTVFELKVTSPSSLMMANKRKLHDNKIHEEKERDLAKNGNNTDIIEDSEDIGDNENVKKRKSEDQLELSNRKKVYQPKQYKDEKYYLKPISSSHFTEKGLSINDDSQKNIEDLILDLQPDDDKSIFRKRSQLQWNKKKKKFIQVDDINDKKKLFVKNEAGQKVLSGSSGGQLYKTWSLKTHKRIPTAGEIIENDVEMPEISFYRHKAKQSNNQNKVKDEIKTVEQIRKMKVEEEKKRQKKLRKEQKMLQMKKEAKSGGGKKKKVVIKKKKK